MSIETSFEARRAKRRQAKVAQQQQGQESQPAQMQANEVSTSPLIEDVANVAQEIWKEIDNLRAEIEAVKASTSLLIEDVANVARLVESMATFAAAKPSPSTHQTPAQKPQQQRRYQRPSDPAPITLPATLGREGEAQ